jgi:hypothetical protein
MIPRFKASNNRPADSDEPSLIYFFGGGGGGGGFGGSGFGIAG